METTNKEFENILKEQVDGYKMYPSARVWQNVQERIHHKQGLTIATILTLFIVAVMLSFTPDQNTKQFTETTNFNTASKEYLAAAIGENNTDANSVFGETNVTKTMESFINSPQVNNPSAGVETNAQQPYFNAFDAIANNANSEQKSISKQVAALTGNNTAVNEEEITNTTAINNATVIENNTQELAIEETTKDKAIIETTKIISAENVANDLTVKNSNVQIAKSTKSRWQYYFVPSISYRTLSDRRNPAALAPVVPVAPFSEGSLEKSIAHKPAVGLEFGVSYVTTVNKFLDIKIGAQLNYNQYNIRAALIQPEVATIALSNGSSQINSLTNLRNNEGASQWVSNNNLQIAIPIGVNFKLAGSDRVQIGIGTTIQPSYLITNKMLLLSTDLKNYTDAPGLVRKFNVNGGLETFVALNGKKVKMQLGPQIRYQFLSTYNKKYPIKENLFDYGFKIGFSKPF